MVHDMNTRFRIFKLLADSGKEFTLSSIAKRLHLDQQRVAYHLPFLVESGLVMREGNVYFPQPIFLDEHLHEICAEKLGEIVDAFSESDDLIVIDDNQDRDAVVTACLSALVRLTIPDRI
jgi:DNA-binding transcriptional ArsR family regulator